MPEPAPSSRVGLYRSGVTSAERLRYTGVSRQHLLDNTIESLRGSVNRKSKNHRLFIGPRGIGKTHLLSCIEDAVQSDAALGERVVVVRFPEESNRTLSFADFLIGICGILKEILEDEPLWQELFAAVEIEEDDARVADTLVPAIREENRKRGRTLVVMLENLGEVLGRQIRKRNDIAALRTFLMSDNGCLLLGTAPLHFDGITDVEQPFYDFFDIQILEALSFEETVEVIRLNLEWEERTAILESLEGMRPRLHALYRMTGGNPRLTMMLYELIAHESVTGVQDQFHLLLDRVSPFYQSRLNDLPPGQRALLECLASMRDREKTPAAIAARMRMSQQETSSLLKRLSDARYVRAVQHPRDGRSRLYVIREGFFDIWLAMALSRGARRRMPFLLEFFSLFHPSIEARDEKRRELRARLLEDGNVDAERALDYLGEVGDEGERARAKFDMAGIFARHGAAEQAASYVLEAMPLAPDDVSQSICRMVANTPSTPVYLSELEEMIAAWKLHRSGEFEAFASRLAEMGKGLTLDSFSETRLEFLRDTLESLDTPEDRIAQRLRIADVLTDLARWDASEDQLRHALTEAEEIAHPQLIASALNDLGQLLEGTNRVAEAEPLMRRALEIVEAELGPQAPPVVSYLNNLAMLLFATSRFEDAELLLRRALEIAEGGSGEQHPSVATCLNSLAILLRATDQPEKAEPLLRRALAVAEAKVGPQHPSMATRLSNLATVLQDINQTEEAEPLVRRALAIAEMAFGTQHPTVAIHMNNLAALLRNTNRLQEAEPLMRRALEIERAAYGDQHPAVATSLNNLSLMLIDAHRLKEAEPLMRRSLEIYEEFARQTGHQHPLFGWTKANVKALRDTLGPNGPG